MKKFFVIGNPISHSLSPELHNFWIKKNKINAVYDKIKLEESELKDFINKLRNEEIHGINVTVPFKKAVIPFLDKLSSEAEESQSVNTIYLQNEKVIGHNTDISGFELAIKHCKYNVNDKAAFILGAGGVVPSIIIALKKMGVSKIFLSNRTKEKAKNLKNFFHDIEILEWGNLPKANMVINATSVGLNQSDEIKLDFSKIGKNNFFYDVIYNQKETNFLKKAKNLGNRIENGKMMFIYQAHQAFTIWHKLMPELNDEIISLLDQ